MTTGFQAEDFGTEYKWKISDLTPFGSNIGLIMYSCSDGAGETKDNLTNNFIITATLERKVMLVHNEHVVEEQPACGETLCSVSDFKAYYQHIVDFDWDTQCPVPEPENTTSTTEAGINGTEVINIVNIINIVPEPENAISTTSGEDHQTLITNEECTREYTDTGSGHFAISGNNQEIKAPWLAALGISRRNKEFLILCSGTILTKKVILTAAHCFFRSKRYFPTNVKVGANNIESIFAEERKIEDKKIHPDYDNATLAYYFDIALVIVDKEFKFCSRISPICLPDASYLHPGEGRGISVQGWGVTENGRRRKEVSQITVIIRAKVTNI